MALFALIPAAGQGARIAGETPKQYLPIAGRPMLWHSVNAVCRSGIETVFVVLSPGDQHFAQCDWRAFGTTVSPLYCGGASRLESVRNGLVAAMAVIDSDDWVLVHDAARPCLPEACLQRLIADCRDDPVGGLLALPVADTVKRAVADTGGAARCGRTEDRSALWLAQTPQMFRAGLLGQALAVARGPVTDESSAIEQLGLQPRLVSGSGENLKVTYPDDLVLAAAILETRR